MRRRPKSEYADLLSAADPRPDDGVPALPNDITGISDVDLIDNMRAQTVWQAYFGTLLVQLEKKEADAETDYEAAKAVAYLEAADAISVTAGKASAASNKAVQNARNRWRDSKTERKAMEMAYNNRERAAGLLSRELTRRGHGAASNRVGRYTP